MAMALSTNKTKRILYVFLRVVDTVIQNTTENEIARSLRRLGYTINTVVAYERKKIPLDGFNNVEYVRKQRIKLWATLRYHCVVLKRMIATPAEVVLVNYPAMHLVPVANLLRIGNRQRPLWVMDIRSMPVDVERNLRGLLLRLRYRLAIFLADRFCDGVTVITPALAEQVEPLLKQLKHIGIWESGVALEHFTHTGGDMRKELDLEGKVVLIYHGIISPNRGLRNLVIAVSLLASHYPELRLLLVGDGPGRAELEGLASNPPLKSLVIFIDTVDYEKIGRYIATADAGVLPFPNITWWAVSSPLKLMEYLAMGLPVIATNIRAIRHVTDRTGGVILAKDNTPVSLAKAIITYLERGCQPIRNEVLEDTISWNAQARALDHYIESIGHLN